MAAESRQEPRADVPIGHWRRPLSRRGQPVAGAVRRRSPRLRRIVAGYTVNRLGTWFGYVALSLAVFDHTHSALAVAALLIAGQALPAFLVPARGRPRRGLDQARQAQRACTCSRRSRRSRSPFSLLAFLAAGGARARGARRDRGARGQRPAARGGGARRARPRRARLAGRERPRTGGATTPRRRRAQGERGAQHRASPPRSCSARRSPACWSAGAGGPAALLIDAASFLICGAMLIDLRPHVEEAEGASVRARLQRRVAAHQRRAGAADAAARRGRGARVLRAAGPIEVALREGHAARRRPRLRPAAGRWGVGVVLGSLVFARAVRRAAGRDAEPRARSRSASPTSASRRRPRWPSRAWRALLGGVGNGVQWASMLSAVQQLTPQRLHGRLMGARRIDRRALSRRSACCWAACWSRSARRARAFLIVAGLERRRRRRRSCASPRGRPRARGGRGARRGPAIARERLADLGFGRRVGREPRRAPWPAPGAEGRSPRQAFGTLRTTPRSAVKYDRTPGCARQS